MSANLTAANGYAVTDFATGFGCTADPPGCFLTGLAFDPAGNLFVVSSVNDQGLFDGVLYKFGPGGGVASKTTLVASAGDAWGVTFGKDGSLFVSRPGLGDVVQLNPSTGMVIRTVASGLNYPRGLATDPLSGDLFFLADDGIYRISNFAGGPGTTVKYWGVLAASALSFASDGLLWITLGDNRVIWITGTNQPQPGSGTIRLPDPAAVAMGLAVSLNPSNSVLYVNRTDGVITKVDMEKNPVTFTDVVTGALSGFFFEFGGAAAVGPDGCVYAEQENRVLKLSNANGPCLAPPLGPLVVPRIQIRPKPPQASGCPPLPVGCWYTAPQLPTPRAGLAVGVVNGLNGGLYALGGGQGDLFLSTVEAYDPLTNSWTTKAPLAAARKFLAAGVVNGALYAVGGAEGGFDWTWSDRVEAYNPATNAWTAKASLPTPRQGLAGAVLNGVLYAVGGEHFDWVTGGPGISGEVDAYYPATGIWATIAPLPTPRSGLAVGVVNGRLYAVGGDLSGAVSSAVEAYDPASKSWTARAPMPTPRAGLAVGVVNGVLYAVGGGDGKGYLSTVEAYDAATNTWTTMLPLPTPRSELAVGVVNGRLYAVGGFNRDKGGWLSTVEVFRP